MLNILSDLSQAFNKTNSAYTVVNAAYTVVNAAFGTANSKIDTVDGVSTGTFTAEGDLVVYGNSTFASGSHTIDSNGVSFAKYLKIRGNPSSGVPL